MSDWHDAERRVEKAQQLYAQRRWHEALAELSAAVAVDPSNSAWLFNMGLILDELGRRGEAVEWYRRCLRIEPDEIEPIYRIGADLCRMGRHDEALLALNRIESLNASFEPAYCWRIAAYAGLGDHEKAEECFYLARQYKDECPECYFNMGQSLFQRGLTERALYCWQRSVDLEPDRPQTHLHIARALRRQGNLEQARQHYVQEWRLDPANVQSLLELGELLMEMGWLEEAGEKFRRAIDIAPADPAGHLHHGRWLLACERLPAARQAVQRAMELDPGYPAAQLTLARIALRERNWMQARKHLRAEYRRRADEPRVLIELANLLVDCGQNRAAAACLERLVHREPNNAAAWQDLAVAQFLCRRFDAGVSSCLEALRCDGNCAEAMFNLALAYQQQGDLLRSMLWIRRARQIDGQDASYQRLELRTRLLWFCGRTRQIIGRLIRRRH